MKNVSIIAVIVIIAVILWRQINDTETTENAATNSVVEVADLRSSATPDARVFIIEPSDGAELRSPFKVEFGIANMKVAPAGSDVEHSGHHHLLIDLLELPDLTKPLPANERIIHFGKGQTETELALPPGQHTLQLLLGNYLHIPHNPPVVSQRINITVSDE